MENSQRYSRSGTLLPEAPEVDSRIVDEKKEMHTFYQFVFTTSECGDSAS
jgi:hypothetical protein